MDTNMSNRKGSVAVLPEKLPTQPVVETVQKQANTNLVAGLVRKSNRILATISTLGFPFKMLADTINIEEGRVTVIARKFFWSSQVHSVDIKDISNIFINTAPFFAQLVIVSKTFRQNEIKINNLRKEEAVFARRIVEGLRTFESKQIDTSSFTKEDLVAKLEELSTTDIVT